MNLSQAVERRDRVHRLGGFLVGQHSGLSTAAWHCRGRAKTARQLGEPAKADALLSEARMLAASARDSIDRALEAA